MTANNSKSYIGYLNKLKNGYSNNYHCSDSKEICWHWLICIDWRNWKKP